MDTPRKIGTLIFFGVPVIVGGGIVYALFGSMTVLFIYEVILLLLAGTIVA